MGPGEDRNCEYTTAKRRAASRRIKIESRLARSLFAIPCVSAKERQRFSRHRVHDNSKQRSLIETFLEERPIPKQCGEARTERARGADIVWIEPRRLSTSVRQPGKDNRRQPRSSIGRDLANAEPRNEQSHQPPCVHGEVRAASTRSLNHPAAIWSRGDELG